VFLLELKDDYRFWNPRSRRSFRPNWTKLDGALRECLGPLQFRPDNLRSPGASLLNPSGNGAAGPGGPREGVIAILHANETYRSITFPATRPGGRAMFTSCSAR
jgi:hypothetical protein